MDIQSGGNADKEQNRLVCSWRAPLQTAHDLQRKEKGTMEKSESAVTEGSNLVSPVTERTLSASEGDGLWACVVACAAHGPSPHSSSAVVTHRQPNKTRRVPLHTKGVCVWLCSSVKADVVRHKGKLLGYPRRTEAKDTTNAGSRPESVLAGEAVKTTGRSTSKLEYR